jgi:hypothetical protein
MCECQREALGIPIWELEDECPNLLKFFNQILGDQILIKLGPI